MSNLAQELDDKVMELVREGLRPNVIREIDLTCITIDVIRHINENGYKIIPMSE